MAENEKKKLIVKTLLQGVKIAYPDASAAIDNGWRKGIVLDANALRVRVFVKTPKQEDEIKTFSLSQDGEFVCTIGGERTALCLNEPDDMVTAILQGMGPGVITA